ncbi:hypothetical protein OG562_02385 [Streptomyces sp. NBC_01275]|uniref:hypothetical protein n=1 Tax=Streptomyces sp. NBC_01275 TaxID=2903807 RepID=UPI0022583A65|nr:hypothetical protein [Streptomyces sp. NBC_01275]MCX4759856.1 hypothetical protein [Streptomyces sp. NBC_01275]
MRRWIKVSVAAATVLGLGGWIAQPYVHEWWLIRSACDGALPDDALRDLVPDGSHVTDTGSGSVPELGDYACTVTVGGDHSADWKMLVLEAYTQRDDQDRELMWAFNRNGFETQAPMSAGLPGFVTGRGVLEFLLRCPDLGKDEDGRPRKMLVRASISRNASWIRPASYETAVAFVNTAAKRLGCGADPLTAPSGVGPADPEKSPKTVPLDSARDTACGWLAGAGLPNPTRWKVAVGLDDAAPTGTCSASAGDESTDDGEQRLDFAAWFGDWSTRLVSGDNDDAPPLSASARCDGEAAHFAVDAPDEVPGVDADKRRALLEAFAEEQVKRRDCSDLRMNG